MTTDELMILRHALGVGDDGRRSSYRNYYVAGADSEPACRSLVDQGLMFVGRASAWSCGTVFSVTDAGKAAAKGSPS